MAEPINNAPGIAGEVAVPEGSPSYRPSAGYAPDDPNAKDAVNKQISRSKGWLGIAEQGIMAAAAGGQASSGALNPVSAFMQGVAAGLQIPSQLYAQKQAQIKSVLDSTPAGKVHPEMFEGHPELDMFKGIPWGLVAPAIATIAQESAKIAAQGTELRETEASKISADTIKNIDEAKPYARLANQSYGLVGADEIKPEELINVRKSDIDNMIKVRSGRTPIEQNIELTDINQKAPGNLAAQYGLPSERRNPYYNMPEKVYEKVLAANAVLANKQVSKMQDTASAMDNVINSLNRANTLINNIQTGPISGRIPGRRLGAEAQEFDQISATILPSMRSGMPGAVSDRDMAIFKDANFGLNKDESVNKKIINQQLAIATRVKDKAEFMSNWATVYGDISGAEANWSKYVRENPLFTATGDINPNVKTYPSYFGAVSGRDNAAWTPEKEARYQELKNKAGK